MLNAGRAATRPLRTNGPADPTIAQKPRSGDHQGDREPQSGIRANPSARLHRGHAGDDEDRRADLQGWRPSLARTVAARPADTGTARRERDPR